MPEDIFKRAFDYGWIQVHVELKKEDVPEISFDDIDKYILPNMFEALQIVLETTIVDRLVKDFKVKKEDAIDYLSEITWVISVLPEGIAARYMVDTRMLVLDLAVLSTYSKKYEYTNIASMIIHELAHDFQATVIPKIDEDTEREHDPKEHWAIIREIRQQIDSDMSEDQIIKVIQKSEKLSDDEIRSLIDVAKTADPQFVYGGIDGVDIITELKDYAKGVVGDVVKSVALVGSTLKDKGKDIDLLYDFGDIELPEGNVLAQPEVMSMIENTNIDLDSYDTFIKVGDRYFYIASGAGREVIENTEYANEQVGRPRQILTFLRKSNDMVPLDDLVITFDEMLFDYYIKDPFKDRHYVTEIGGMKAGFGAKYQLRKFVTKLKTFFPSGQVNQSDILSKPVPELKEPVVRRLGEKSKRKILPVKDISIEKEPKQKLHGGSSDSWEIMEGDERSHRTLNVRPQGPLL